MNENIATPNKRYLYIDIVRCLCMICIILAHVNPPSMLHTFRSFDVVGLVMISTICMKPYTNLKNYLKSIGKRIRRLVIPAYIFIICVLFSVYILCKYLNIPYIYNKTNVINAFLLIDGIGYVWIIRVLLINAILTPLLFKFAEFKSIYTYFCIILVLLLLKMLFIKFPYDGTLMSFIFKYFVLYSAGYFGIALFALIQKRNAYKFFLRNIIAAIFILISYKILCNYLYGDDLLVLEKHPPFLDWILYGVIISDILLLTSKKLEPFILYGSKLYIAITWFSTNSFQIYFIHAWLLIMFNTYMNFSDEKIIMPWWIEFIIVFILSVISKIIFDYAHRNMRKILNIRKMCKQPSVSVQK